MRIHHALISISIGAVLAVPAVAQQDSSRVIVNMTKVPAAGAGPDSRGDIAGTIRGLHSPQKYKVVLYARADWWYVQPLVDSPYTDIGADGRWSNWTHLGHRYSALVVRPGFKPAAKVQALPELGADVIGKVEMPAAGR